MRAAASFILCVMVSSCGERPLEPRDADPGVPNFTVATFNTFDENASDPATIEAIGATNADIVALQETTPDSQEIVQQRYRTKYPYTIFHNGLGVISSWPMVEVAYMPNDGWHSAMHVAVQTPAGWLELLNVHLSAPEGRFVKSVQSIADLPAAHRDQISLCFNQNDHHLHMAVGDFNEDTGGAAVQWLEARGFSNMLPLYHPGQFTWRAQNSVGGQFEQTLDHVLIDDSLVPLNAYVGEHGVSDHMPVITHVEAARQPW